MSFTGSQSIPRASISRQFLPSISFKHLRWYTHTWGQASQKLPTSPLSTKQPVRVPDNTWQDLTERAKRWAARFPETSTSHLSFPSTTTGTPASKSATSSAGTPGQGGYRASTVSATVPVHGGAAGTIGGANGDYGITKWPSTAGEVDWCGHSTMVRWWHVDVVIW